MNIGVRDLGVPRLRAESSRAPIGVWLGRRGFGAKPTKPLEIR